MAENEVESGPAVSFEIDGEELWGWVDDCEENDREDPDIPDIEEDYEETVEREDNYEFHFGPGFDDGFDDEPDVPDVEEQHG